MKESHARPRPRESAILFLAALCLLGTIAYSNSLSVPFVFDDLVSIERNTGVRFGDYLSGPLLWTRSLLYVTFALNHQYAGIEVWSYHVINLIIHLLNGILVFFIARHIFEKCSGRDPAGFAGWGKSSPQLFAFVAAAFFLVHPVQTESVTYISSRSELLSAFFYALAVLLFIRWPEKKIGLLLAAIVGVLFVLGLGGKETVISLPAVLVLYDYIFLSQGSFRPLLKRWRFYSVFLAGGVLAAVYLLRQWATVLGPDPSLLSPWRYFLTQLTVFIRYLQILFVPAGLNLDYDFQPATSLLEPSVFLSLLVLSSLLVIAYVWRRNYPVFAFSTFWFFITLAPTSSFIPIQDVIFEHRLYPALMGVCLSFPVFVAWATRRLFAFNSPPGKAGFAAPALCFAILAVLLTATLLRNEVWRDPLRLYSDIVSKSPGKERAYRALAMEFVKRGDLPSATGTMQTAISKVPAESAELLYNDLGNIYLQTRQYDLAIHTFTKSLTSGHAAIAYNNIGVAYLNLWYQLLNKRPVISAAEFDSEKSRILGEGKKAFRASYDLDKSNLGSLDSFVNLSYFEGNTDGLRLEFEARHQATPSFETAYSLGRLELWAGNFAKAAEYFDRAAQANAGERLLEFNHGYALSQLGNIPGAIDRYTRALRIDPTFREARYNLAYVYWKSGDLTRAVEHFNEVLARDPRHIPTLISLAKVDIERGNPSQARDYLQQVIRINPQEKEALAILQSLGG